MSEWTDGEYDNDALVRELLHQGERVETTDEMIQFVHTCLAAAISELSTRMGLTKDENIHMVREAGLYIVNRMKRIKGERN